MSLFSSRLALPVALAGLLLVPSVAAAQSGPVGIGFAQAEEGTWWCRGDNAVTTLDCARAKCVADTGGIGCLRTRWCYTADWSGMMVVWLPDFHSTEIVCGAPGRPALDAALAAFCFGNEYATSCDVFAIIDPDGVELEAALTIPGGGAVPAQ